MKKKRLSSLLAITLWAACNTSVIGLAAPSAGSSESAKTVVVVKHDNVKAQQKEDLKVEFRWFIPKMNFTAKGNDFYIFKYANEVTGTTEKVEDTLDFQKDLGFKDKSGPELRASWRNVEFDYLRIHQEADKTLAANRGVYFDGTYYSPGNPVSGKLDLDYASVDWVSKKLPTGGAVDVQWTAGLKYLRMYAEEKGDPTKVTGSPTKSKQFNGVLPIFGIRAAVPLDREAHTVFYSSLSGIYAGSRGRLCDFEAGLKYKLANQWDIAAGYRVIDLKADKDDLHVDFRLTGPYLGVAYQF